MIKPLLSWDECDIVDQEAKYRMDHLEDFNYDKDISERDIRNELWDDSIFWMDTYEYFYESLTDILRQKQKRYANKDWYVSMHNFGWRGIDGYKILTADTGEDFLMGILPKCECTFHIYNHGRGGLSINNFHHDSPTGAEWYYANLLSLKAWKQIDKEIQ